MILLQQFQMIPLQTTLPPQYPQFNLEESERIYQQLLEENRLLRERTIQAQQPWSSVPQPLPQRYVQYRPLPQFQYQSPRPKAEYQPPPFYSPQELNAKVSRYPQKVAPQPESEPVGGRLIEKICPYLSQEQSSTALISLAQRNKYLQGKIFMLRKELQKQNKKIAKFQHHMTHQMSCQDCYQDRYYALLRVTSPS